MRRWARRGTAIVAGALALAPWVVSAPLWPNASYTGADRASEVLRGLRFIESLARRPDNLRDYGDDFLWCFHSLAATSADTALRHTAAAAGHEAALRWTAAHSTIPPHAGADDLVALATAAYAAKRLGAPPAASFQAQFRRAAATLSVRDYLQFDPAREAPAAALPLRQRYDMWCDALITSFFGNVYGVTLGAPWERVVRHLPEMRPYPAFATRFEFYSLVNAITHTVYTANRYSVYALNPDCLKPEFDFLLVHLPDAVALRDPETIGEFIDTLRSFGLATTDARLRPGLEFLLSTQNPDGSWGDPEAKDVYTRYHATWTAMDALREYRFRPAQSCPVSGNDSAGRF